MLALSAAAIPSPQFPTATALPSLAVAVADEATVFVLFGCALFAACLFVYIFYAPGEVESGEQKTRLTYLLERKEATYENLRDLNFEYKAGKLSEQDYAVQRASLEDEAAAILAEIESIEKAQAVVRQGTRRADGERA